MTREEKIQKLIDEKNGIDNYGSSNGGIIMWNTIKRIFKSIFKGIRTAVLVGIYAIGICMLYFVITHEENWLFTLTLIIIAFFSSIYYFSKNE